MLVQDGMDATIPVVPENIMDYVGQTHYADIEAIGFWDIVHTINDIHCLCSITEDDKVILFHDAPELDGVTVYDEHDKKTYTIPKRSGSLIDGFRYWYRIGAAKGKLSVHNAMTYDKPIIEKVMPKCIIPMETWRDTFNQSKAQFQDRPNVKGAKSAHGLQAYGIKFGVRKPPIDDFTRFDAYILHRVVEDCRIQKKTQLYLDKEAEMLLAKGIGFDECLEIENKYAKGCAEQEVRGVRVDRPHMEQCIVEWDERTEVIASEVEPKLPPTVKPNTGRVTRSEMVGFLNPEFERLGMPRRKIPIDQLEEVNKNGETVMLPMKPYYKPSVNFHRIEKVNQYQGFYLSHGDSPAYVKKNELTKWIKEHYPDTKPKDWGIEKTVIETKVLNANACQYFGREETETDVICGAHTRVSFNKSSMTQHEVVKGFLIKLGLKHCDEWNFKKDASGAMAKAKENMIVSYPKKASHENQMHKNVKKGDPIVTSPKVGEKDYEQLPDGIGQSIGEYNTTVHRRRFLSNPKDPEHKGLMAYIREDGRIPAGLNNFATSSGRACIRFYQNKIRNILNCGEALKLWILSL